MNIKIVNLTSKKGNPFTALKVTIGAYEGLLFPSPAELAYIQGEIQKTSHEDFQNVEEE